VRLFDRKLLLVAGKGGVGRTTVAITLAIAAGQLGKRAAVVELYGASAIGPRFGLPGRTYEPRPIAPNVDTFSLTPWECADDFARQKLRVNALVRVLFHNAMFRAFVDAVPGLHDLFQLGKLNHLASTPEADDPNYDLIVVDAPATGHGLTLLDAASSMREVVGSGLVADESDLIRGLLHDPTRTGLVLVTLPDALPVNETLELVAQLEGRSALVAGAVVNQVRRVVLPGHGADVVTASLRARGAGHLADLAERAVATAERQDRAIARLRDALAAAAGPVPPPVVPLRRIEPQELKPTDAPKLANELLIALGYEGEP
jgi:anion-transporting  ArsA/GET3 family ATPase